MNNHDLMFELFKVCDHDYKVSVEADGIRFDNFKFELIKVNDKLILKLNSDETSTITIACIYCKSLECVGKCY